MPRFLIYSSPAHHDDPASWYRYRDRVREVLERAAVAASVTVDDDPLFTYGADPSSVISRVNATGAGRGEIVIAHWSAIVFYSAAVFFLGDDVKSSAVRAALHAEPFLKEHAGDYSLLTGSCYGYDLCPFGDHDILEARRIVECVPNRVYVGASYLVNNEEGVVDEARFEVLRRHQLAPHRIPEAIVIFRPRIESLEEETWRTTPNGDGLAVLSEDDPRLPATLEVEDLIGDELTLFMGADADGRARPRVTIGRCHVDDTFVCLYNHRYVEDPSLRFLI